MALRNISLGWLYGFKLYLVVNDRSELLTVCLIPDNTDDRLLDLVDKPLLRKRAIIGSTAGQFKTICQIEHSRHRSPFTFLVNLIARLITCCHQPKKFSLDLDSSGVQAIHLIQN